MQTTEIGWTIIIYDRLDSAGVLSGTSTSLQRVILIGHTGQQTQMSAG